MNNLVEKYIIIEIFEKLIRLNNYINSNKVSIKEFGMKITLGVFEKAFQKAIFATRNAYFIIKGTRTIK